RRPLPLGRLAPPPLRRRGQPGGALLRRLPGGGLAGGGRELVPVLQERLGRPGGVGPLRDVAAEPPGDFLRRRALDVQIAHHPPDPRALAFRLRVHPERGADGIPDRVRRPGQGVFFGPPAFPLRPPRRGVGGVIIWLWF